MILALTFVVFTGLFSNMFIKRSYIILLFIHFSIIICINFVIWINYHLYLSFVLFLGFFYCFMFVCLLLFCFFVLLLGAFVNVSHVFSFFTNFSDYNSSSVSTFFHIHANIDKEANCIQSNNNASSKKIFGYIFQPRFYFSKFGLMKMVT